MQFWEVCHVFSVYFGNERNWISRKLSAQTMFIITRTKSCRRNQGKPQARFLVSQVHEEHDREKCLNRCHDQHPDNAGTVVGDEDLHPAIARMPTYTIKSVFKLPSALISVLPRLLRITGRRSTGTPWGRQTSKPDRQSASIATRFRYRRRCSGRACSREPLPSTQWRR